MKKSIYIYPTDTVWGIGPHLDDLEGIARIHQIKGSDPIKPMSILFTNIELLKKYINFPVTKNGQLLDFFSLETTLLVPKDLISQKIPLEVFCGSQYIGIRFLQNKRLDILFSGLPVLTTSLNLSGEQEIIDDESANTFSKKYVPYAQMISSKDAGITPSGAPSTIVKIFNNDFSRYEIIRKGRRVDEIQHYLGLLSTSIL